MSETPLLLSLPLLSAVLCSVLYAVLCALCCPLSHSLLLYLIISPVVITYYAIYSALRYSLLKSTRRAVGLQCCSVNALLPTVSSILKAFVDRSKKKKDIGCSTAQENRAMRAKKSVIVSMRATITAPLRRQLSSGSSSFSSVSSSLSTSDSSWCGETGESLTGEKPPPSGGGKATASSSMSKYLKPTKPKYHIRENPKYPANARETELTIKRAKLQIKNAYKAGRAKDVIEAYKLVR